EYICHRHHLRLLNYAGIGFSTGYQFDLPSWVPDFQGIASAGWSHSIPRGFNSNHNISSLASTPKPFVDDKGHLHAFGYICDVVSTAQQRVDWGSEGLFQFCTSYIFGREVSLDIAEILRLLVSSELSRYVIGIPRLQAFFQTVLNGTSFYSLDQDL